MYFDNSSVCDKKFIFSTHQTDTSTLQSLNSQFMPWTHGLTLSHIPRKKEQPRRIFLLKKKETENCTVKRDESVLIQNSIHHTSQSSSNTPILSYHFNLKKISHISIMETIRFTKHAEIGKVYVEINVITCIVIKILDSGTYCLSENAIDRMGFWGLYDIMVATL